MYLNTTEDAFNDMSTTSMFSSGASGTQSIATLQKGLGYDADGAILSSYERWGD